MADVRGMNKHMSANVRVDQRAGHALIESKLFKNGCLDLNTVYKRYFEWVLKLKCE